jgi:hypothetical protein
MIRRTRPILLVLGPAGSGKTTLGRSLAARGLQHLDLDTPPGRVGPDDAPDALREGIATLFQRARVGPLALAIESMDGHRERRGTVVTFSSVETLPPRHAAAVERAGFDLVVLYGTGADVLDGYLARERAAGRAAPPDHWIAHNAASYAQFSAPHHAPHRVTTYRDGRFVGADGLVAAVTSHLARRNPQWSGLALQANPGAGRGDGAVPFAPDEPARSTSVGRR